MAASTAAAASSSSASTAGENASKAANATVQSLPDAGSSDFTFVAILAGVAFLTLLVIILDYTGVPQLTGGRRR